MITATPPPHNKPVPKPKTRAQKARELQERLAKRRPLRNPYGLTQADLNRNLDLRDLDVPEDAKVFLKEFGAYRYEIIVAKLNRAGYIQGHWQTWKKGKVTPKKLYELLIDPECVVGVRFGTLTTYAMLDVDAGSQYHNKEGRLRIEMAIATLDINTNVTWVRSSESDGWHCYIHFDQQYSTFKVACLLHETLEAAGLDIAPGTLEIFPNRKAYNTEYNGHRLPLQRGSYLLDSGKASFRAYNAASLFPHQRTKLAPEQLDSAYERYKETNKFLWIINKNGGSGIYTAKAMLWKSKLESAKRRGWTGDAQTNLLGYQIGQYLCVFEGITDFGELQQRIIEECQSAPGYRQYCGHQRDIARRAADWAKAVLKRCRPYGTAVVINPCSGGPNKNNAKKRSNRRLIKKTIIEMRKAGKRITVSAVARESGLNRKTVIKHQDLLNLWSGPLGFSQVINKRRPEFVNEREEVAEAGASSLTQKLETVSLAQVIEDKKKKDEERLHKPLAAGAWYEFKPHIVERLNLKIPMPKSERPFIYKGWEHRESWYQEYKTGYRQRFKGIPSAFRKEYPDLTLDEFLEIVARWQEFDEQFESLIFTPEVEKFNREQEGVKDQAS